MLALGAWALYAALAPTLLDLDHQGLLNILHSGDPKALTKGAYFGPYPLRALVPLACGFALLALVGARAWRNAPGKATPQSPSRRSTISTDTSTTRISGSPV